MSLVYLQRDEIPAREAVVSLLDFVRIYLICRVLSTANFHLEDR